MSGKQSKRKPVLNSSIRKKQAVSESMVFVEIRRIKANLPLDADLIRSPVEIGARVWAMKTNLLNKWLKGTVTSSKEGNNNEKLYKVRLDSGKYLRKFLPAKYLAYENLASVIIPVGARIIARYTDSAGQSDHYAGIIAELPKLTNRKRYLVFFDDGCAQYVEHEDIHVVCAESDDVADDVHEKTSEFVRGYLQRYPEHPVIKLRVDQYVKTEYNFEWSDAQVIEVDCNMVKLLFPASQRVEWIYRGSPRLDPLRNELINKEQVVSEGLEMLNTESGGAKANLPSVGDLARSPLEIGARVWAMETNLLNLWVKGTVTGIIEQDDNEKLYKVRQYRSTKHLPNPLPAKYLAYENPASVIIPVGTRIIARDTDVTGQFANYAGIVAESSKITTRKRYLVFFDHGGARYVKHKDVHVVCAQSVDVADDVHENITEFVRYYLQQYPEHFVVNLEVEQIIRVECDFKWKDAKVIKVDCSMVKLRFLTNDIAEWIYRGASCLEPMYNEMIRKKEVVHGEIFSLEILNVDLPPALDFLRSPVKIGDRVWAMRTNLLNVWLKGIVTSSKDGNNNEKVYKVHLDSGEHMPEPLPAKYLAYENPVSEIIPVGTRIIARYTNFAGLVAHYAGIVAEPPKLTNHERYLVFFDHGGARYVKHEDVHVVCAQNDDVADDVHETTSEFVKGYLERFPEHPMVKLRVDQSVKTEHNSEWSDAQVMEVDCSMVKLLFPTSQRIEWIYRGSPRLEPLRNELVHNLELF